MGLQLFSASSTHAQNGLGAFVNWIASDSPDVVGYNIYYGTSSRHYTNVIFVGGNTTTMEINGLDADTTYFLAVTTVDSGGNESSFSTETYFATPAPPVLSALPYTDNYGNPYVEITSTQIITRDWELDYTFDLVNWGVYDFGYESVADDFVPTNLDYYPLMFFRIIIY